MVATLKDKDDKIAGVTIQFVGKWIMESPRSGLLQKGISRTHLLGILIHWDKYLCICVPQLLDANFLEVNPTSFTLLCNKMRYLLELKLLRFIDK